MHPLSRPCPEHGDRAAADARPLHVIDDDAHVPHVEQPERFVAALTRIEAPASNV